MRIPVKTNETPRAFHVEETAADQPLSADLIQDVMGMEGLLYEVLTDNALTGNDTRTNNGHAHGRHPHDGVYHPRNGTFDIGYLFSQSTQSTDFEQVGFEQFNTGGPDASGEEQPGDHIALETPSIYLSQHYTHIEMSVLLRCATGGQARGRLSLIRNGSVISSSECLSSSTSWERYTFSLAIGNTEDFSGWVQLSLELKSGMAGVLAYIATDDRRFSSSLGVSQNGLGYLVGEGI